jgi:glycosyltransferase involved in cell wall biosynthesis
MSGGKTVIVHVAPTPFFADRGCHIRIRNEIEALRHSQHNVILCAYHHGRDVEGMDIRRIWPVPGYSKLDAGYSPYRFLADALLFFLTLKTVWQERPVLLHCHLHEGALIGWAVKKCLFWRRLPVVMDMQGSLSGELAAYRSFDGNSLPLRLFRTLEGLICRMPDFFLCSSRRSRDCLLEDFAVAAEKTLLLEDVVPDSFFASSARRREGLIPAGRRVVIYTGSLLPGKGLQHLLEAMHLLCAERDDLHFVLAGYPAEAARDYVAAHGLLDRCLLPGQFSYNELTGWLALGDVAVEPKEADAGEASGKLLHYMAAGLPTVCFDTANNRHMLGEAGCYALSGDAAGLAAAVRAALANPEEARRRGSEGRRIVRDRYSSSALGRALRQVYRKHLAD